MVIEEVIPVERLAMTKCCLRFKDPHTELQFRSTRVAAVLAVTCAIFLCTAAPGAFVNFLSINMTEDQLTPLNIAKWTRAVLPLGSLGLLIYLWFHGVNRAFWERRGSDRRNQHIVYCFDAVVSLLCGVACVRACVRCCVRACTRAVNTLGMEVQFTGITVACQRDAWTQQLHA